MLSWNISSHISLIFIISNRYDGENVIIILPVFPHGSYVSIYNNLCSTVYLSGEKSYSFCALTFHLLKWNIYLVRTWPVHTKKYRYTYSWEFQAFQESPMCGVRVFISKSEQIETNIWKIRVYLRSSELWTFLQILTGRRHLCVSWWKTAD